MKLFLKFFLLLTGILLLSAFLAPILYDFLPFKFERIFNRLVMIFSLAAVFFFVRIRRQTFVDYGLAWKRESLSLLLFSFVSGGTVLWLANGIKITFGAATWASAGLPAAEWAVRIANAFFAAFLIGFLEEFFFRGFIFHAFKAWGKFFSLGLTNLFYSVVHFVDHKSPFVGPDPNFGDSLRLIAAPFDSLRYWNEIWPGILGLFIFGLILNGVLLSTGSLYGPIGLHAGCVFFLKLDGLWILSLNQENIFWGSAQIYDGILGWILFGSFYFIFQQAAKKAGPSGRQGTSLVL